MSERFQKCFDRSVLFRYFSLLNDSLGLAYLTLNEVSAKQISFLASPSSRRKSFEKGRLTYIRDSTSNRELKPKMQQFLFERAMRRPGAQNYGSRITTKTTTSMKIAVRQMMLGRQEACMCVSVDSRNVAGAFDKVSHAGLLHKASVYGLDGALNGWVSSYLIGWCPQRVGIKLLDWMVPSTGGYQVT